MLAIYYAVHQCLRTKRCPQPLQVVRLELFLAVQEATVGTEYKQLEWKGGSLGCGREARQVRRYRKRENLSG